MWRRGCRCCARRRRRRANDPRILYHFAVALKDTGKRDEAIKMLNAVVANKGEFGEKAEAQKLLDELNKG